MAIEWPSSLPLRTMQPVLNNPPGLVTGPAGSSQQTGGGWQYFRVRCELPDMDRAQAKLAFGTLLRAVNEGLKLRMQREGLDTPAVTCTLSADWSSGYGLSVSSVPSGVALSVGDHFSIGTANIHWLYCLGAASAAGTTTRTLTSTGLPKVTHPSGSTVRFEQPWIEGSVLTAERLIDVDQITKGFSFEVVEI